MKKQENKKLKGMRRKKKRSRIANHWRLHYFMGKF